MTPSKHYLGDSVYVQEEDGSLLLTVEGLEDQNGNKVISEAIYLESETLCELQKFLINWRVEKRVNPGGGK